MARLEHIGIAVQDVEDVARLYETLLGVRPYKQETVAHEGVRTHFLAAGTAKLELLEALGPDSPVARHLERRGEGLHHLAFEVEDAEAHLRHLREQGFTPLSETPRPGADGKRIFFLHPRDTHGVLVEFCESVAAPPEPTEVPAGGGSVAVCAWGDTNRPAVLVLAEDEALARHLELHHFVLTLADADVEALGAVLEFFDLAQAGVVGFGRGGAVALHAAAAFPRRLARVAVFSLGRDDLDPLPAVAQPVLVGGADSDAEVPPESVLALYRALPDSRLALLPGTYADAVLLTPLLRRFFAGAS